MARQAKEPAAKAKRPASTKKRKAETQPEPTAAQPASRTKAGKKGRGTKATPQAAPEVVDTPIRASKRARIEKPPTVQLIKPPPKQSKAAKRTPKPAAAPASGKASASIAAVSKAPTSAASRKQAIRAKARAASEQKPAAAPAKPKKAQREPVAAPRKGKAATKKQSTAAAADAEQRRPESERAAAQDAAGPAAAAPLVEPVVQPSRVSKAKRKGGKASTRLAAGEAPPAPVAAQSEPAGPASDAAQTEAAVLDAEPTAEPMAEHADAPEGADGDAAAADAGTDATQAELPAGHEGLTDAGDGVHVLADDDEHEAGLPDAGASAGEHGGQLPAAHRKSIIRTRTGQVLELELAATRAPHPHISLVSALWSEGRPFELGCLDSSAATVSGQLSRSCPDANCTRHNGMETHACRQHLSEFRLAGAGEPRVRQPRATALAAAQKLADFVAHQEETLRVCPHAFVVPRSFACCWTRVLFMLSQHTECA